MTLNWYVATLIIVSRHKGEPQHLPLCAEQIRLIRAHSADEAYEKALQLGRAEEHAYESIDGNNVSWEFVGLEDLEEIEGKSIRDGREVRNRFFNHAHPNNLVSEQERLSVFLTSKHEQPQENKLPNERFLSD